MLQKPLVSIDILTIVIHLDLFHTGTYLEDSSEEPLLKCAVLCP